jgi:hypothetical protein
MDNMVTRKLILYLIAATVILPTTLAAALTSVIGIPFAFASIGSRGHGAAMATLALTLGWTGIVVMWKLFFHFRKKELNPSHAYFYCGGLFAGVAVSGFFVFFSGGTLFSRVFIFGWPIIGAAVFYGFLFKNSVKRNRD